MIFARRLLIVIMTLLLISKVEASPPRTSYSEFLRHTPTFSDEPIYAAQVLLFYSKDKEGLRNEIAQLKNAGFNTIIVRLFQNRGDRPYPIVGKTKVSPGVYFKTKYAPVVYDLLSDVLEIAHNLNMRVFAWMTTRYCDWAYSKSRATYVYDFARDAFVPGKGLNLFSEWTKDYLQHLYADLAGYNIDGILFQDDLVLRHNEGFSAEARNKFSEKYGYLPRPDIFYEGIYYSKQDRKYYVRRYTERYREFARFKNQQILELTDAIINSVKRVNPNVEFALNCYYEAGLMPDKALLWLAQDLKQAKDMPFDYFSMMSYHDQIKKELDLSEEESINRVVKLAKNLLNELGEPGRVIMKIQTVDWDSGRLLSPTKIKELVSEIKQVGNFNIAFVPYRNNSKFYDMTESIKR